MLVQMTDVPPFRFQTRIRFIDTDASGRIHYTAMFRYFESAEIEFMRSLGVTYGGRQLDFPRVHVECDFLVPMVHDDLIDIEVCLTKLGRSSGRLEFRTLRDGIVMAKGAIVIVCVDKQKQQPVPIPDEFRAKLEAVLCTPQETVAGGK
jgi:YbgC/YbaW family acyl-CoA thioester hydrolase